MASNNDGPGGPTDGRTASVGDAPPSIELRALYEQFERAPTIAERQAIWNAIVAHKRSRETRVGTDAVQARDEVLDKHKRRRFWLF